MRGVTLFNNVNSDVRQIFDPVRALMVEGKILNWFDFRGDLQISAYARIRLNPVRRIPLVSVDP